MPDPGRDASMEDILASIRRVIADDAGARPAVGRTPDPAPPSEREDVLELDQPLPEEAPLVSPDAAEASRETLARLSQLSALPPSAPPGEGALEAAVRDMLRPLLKDWLDQRLPEIVEEIVTREVARITGARR